MRPDFFLAVVKAQWDEGGLGCGSNVLESEFKLDSRV
jgi:hypothetical protein